MCALSCTVSIELDATSEVAAASTDTSVADFDDSESRMHCSPNYESALYEDDTREEECAVHCPDIMHGEPLTDRKSTFQAHVAEVTSKQEVYTCTVVL